jgi:hypothetical protein
VYDGTLNIYVADSTRYHLKITHFWHFVGIFYTECRSNRSINVESYGQSHSNDVNGQCANHHEAHAVLAQTVSTRMGGRTDGPWTRILLQKITVTHLLKKFPNSMKPEGSLRHPQHPASSPINDPDKSNPRSPALYKSKD